ncbi:MAG: hypothetical protein ACTS77_02075 [Arsenophonus sp. NC-TX2-MAG3]
MYYIIDLSKLLSGILPGNGNVYISPIYQIYRRSYLSVSSLRGETDVDIHSGSLLVMNSSTNILSVIGTSIQLYPALLAWLYEVDKNSV